ncbi:hypothetical protein PQB71_gp31 [Mycobacterium phage Taptic]|uniref:DUF7172 domain-containing protein n=1 Tax=Mycobacterium phage Taptic TaxID=1920305 RepID=A0A1J0ME31_9CAUD|nr:hypothetical protein PQB71_gp31 [Mycobacterium phage Taptic]APD19261.1 hypothetical protein SEA_TAPTIC_31 [Mycobacterium phage Taptic]
MTHPDHFTVLDDELVVQPWMQQRWVAGNEVPGSAKTYDPAGSGNKDEAVLTVRVEWTNNTPIQQQVYGMVSRDGCSVYLQARSRAYLSERHGYLVDEAPNANDIVMVEVSRFGTGMDIGKAGTLGTGTSFCVSQHDSNSSTYPLMPQMTGLVPVQPGETISARVDVKFVSEFWENTSIDGGESEAESGFLCGAYRIDLFAIPAVSPTPERPTPQVIGYEWDVSGTGDAEVDVPAEAEPGDVLMAIIANNFGLPSNLYPQETGWTQILGVNDTGLSALSILDCQMKVYIREVTDDEPDQYTFNGGTGAEMSAVLLAISGAAPEVEYGWRAAAAQRRRFWERNTGHVAPSIDMRGQLLICASYFGKPPIGVPDITQTPPAGMEEIVDLANDASSLAVAYLEDPPHPTGNREFVLSQEPLGALGSIGSRTIAVSILVPGAYGT